MNPVEMLSRKNHDLCWEVMNKDHKNLVHKLRFPEFRDEGTWAVYGHPLELFMRMDFQKRLNGLGIEDWGRFMCTW